MYEVDVYWEEELMCEIVVSNKTVFFKNHECSAPKILYPFGIREHATYENLMEFYESRCFPKERENCKELLKLLGVDTYEPELICRKTHGTQWDDFIWLQFSDEDKVSYKDIRLR